MSKIRIKTITPVHIGSGQILQKGNDFVVRKGSDDQIFVGIVDPKKVMSTIGEENIDSWVLSIERGFSTDKIVEKFAPNKKLADYTQRIDLLWSDTETNELKEQIHSLGKPYIPGSSIKGAIRTSLMSYYSRNVQDLKEKISYNKIERNGRISYSANAKKIENEIFGDSPNTDFMRFIQVGDAYFGSLCDEVVLRMVNINEREKQSFWDESKHQLIEAIAPCDESEFKMCINTQSYSFSKGNVKSMPSEVLSIESLFEIINKHTKSLLEDEIDYWNDRIQGSHVDDYIERINEILEEVNNCSNKSCVLRIGHGSGWRFITGGWAETLDENTWENVINASRPNNNRYENYNFPKSRRLTDEVELLGFVKLTLV